MQKQELERLQEMLSYVASLGKAETLREVEDIAKDFAYSQMGMDGYTIEISDGKEQTILTSRPKEWMELYEERDYHSIDPIVTYGIQIALSQKSGFLWEDALTKGQMPPAGFRVIRDSQKFGINYGLNVFSRGFGRMTAFSMYSSDKQRPREAWTHFRALTEYFSHAVHQALCRILDGQNTLYKKIASLSPKETSALQLWAIHGNVDLVSEKMGISRRAVHTHLASAREKFDVQTNAQMVSAYCFHERM